MRNVSSGKYTSALEHVLQNVLVFFSLISLVCAPKLAFAQPGLISHLRDEKIPIAQIVFLAKSAFVAARCEDDCSSIELPKFKDRYTISFQANDIQHEVERTSYLLTHFLTRAKRLTPGVDFVSVQSHDFPDILFNLVEVEYADESTNILGECGGKITEREYSGGTYNLYYFEQQSDATEYAPSRDLLLLTCSTLAFNKVLDFRENAFLVFNDTPSSRHLTEILSRTTMTLRNEPTPSVSRFISGLILQFEEFRRQISENR